QLHVSLQVAERGRIHRFVITLSLPNSALSAHAEEPHLRNSFDRALKRLLRQLKEYKELIRREHLHNRARADKQAGVPIDELAIGQVVADKDLDKFKAGLGKHITSLESLISSEVLELTRRHPGLELNEKELLERTLTHALDFFYHKPRHLSRRSWLFRSAMAVLDETVPPHSGIQDPTAAPAQPIELGGWEVVINHEDDAIATEAASMLSTEQLKPVVESKLSELPRDWRRAFRMHYVEGFDAQEIGELLDLDDQQVMFRLRSAAEFLRDHISEFRGQ
ncbi:MAG: DNA-directed RNA polymerase specialized sigma24 family protein, partial [Planctomycetota bacterium]